MPLASAKDYVYLASPYSRFPGGMVAAFTEACVSAAALIDHGVPVFSPIAHSHPIADMGSLDATSHDLWLAADAPMMHHAAALIVLKIDGWQDSVGVAAEINAFKAAGKRVLYLDPGDEHTIPSRLAAGVA
jgi:hypothetical protein